MYSKCLKRVFDFLIGFFGLIILSIPMLLIAIMVKCESKGPAVFKCERVGMNGKPFKFYKFRSMRTDAPKDCATRLLESDKYITKVGKFLRATSLDELPQLWCLVVGTMSLIGPRPAVLSEKELNEKKAVNGVDRVRPGMTGWAQVNGRDITAADIDKKVAFDKEYVENLSIWFDIKIFFKTIACVLTHKGVKEGDVETAKETKQVSVPVNAVAEAVTIQQTSMYRDVVESDTFEESKISAHT